jgi:hypothetical protein
MVVYGFLVLWGLVGVNSGVVGTLAAEMDLPESSALSSIALISGTTVCLAAYFIGRWVGTRCLRRGVVAILLIAFLFAAAQTATDTLLMPKEAYAKAFGVERSFGHILLRFTLATVIVSALALIGYWRGRKRRLSKYLNYLLGVLPAETRDTVVELAFDEAQRVASASGRARISTAS